MKLYNATRKIILATNLKEAKSAMDKLLGLHLKTNPRSLLFNTRFGIHTLFLREAIDILVLNSKKNVVVAKTLKPNRILLYNPIYSMVIELPCGTISKSKTKIGDQLTF